jgi:transcriptional regulator with XRE-family HTH domain
VNVSSCGHVGHGRRHDLAKFLKAKRAGIEPSGLDLPLSRRRRVSGLRREEVALLCGISTTWYTQLEAGAPITVSPALLSRLAEVLRLTMLERAYLFSLAIDELHDVAAFLPSIPILATRIEAETFEAEIDHVLRVHRGLKTHVYGALVNDRIHDLRPYLDEAKCPIGYWLHEDLALERRRDSSYNDAARAHAAFHREIDHVVHASETAGIAVAERLVLCAEGYVSAAATLERTFAEWPRQLAS